MGLACTYCEMARMVFVSEKAGVKYTGSAIVMARKYGVRSVMYVQVALNLEGR